jgi:hypothetical protein
MYSPSRFPFKQVGHAGPALESRVDELRGSLRLIPPSLLAERAGAAYLPLGQGRGEFHLALLGAQLVLTYPDFQALTAADNPLPVMKQALLLYYFLTSDGVPPAGNWVSFADLPDGRVYASAFQGYSGDELAKVFGLDLRTFQSACESLNGVPHSLGDAAYGFQALPRLDTLVVYHLGDEDFPSTCKVLFDSNTQHYLPTEACAILGSMLTQKILRATNQKPGF